MYADVIHIVVAAKRVLLKGKATRFPFQMIILFLEHSFQYVKFQSQTESSEIHGICHPQHKGTAK
jgi:hypothetical protein